MGRKRKDIANEQCGSFKALYPTGRLVKGGAEWTVACTLCHRMQSMTVSQFHEERKCDCQRTACLQASPQSLERLERIKQLRAEGVPVPTIAGLCRVTRARIYQILNLGLKRGNRVTAPKQPRLPRQARRQK